MGLSDQCPVCGGVQLQEFLRRTDVPVHQNLLFPSAAAAREMTRGILAMNCCRDCGFVFNRSFDAKLLSYGSQYDNSQQYSNAFARHVDGLVEHLVQERGVRKSAVVEVGCGKGDFLRRLVAYPGTDNTGLGFDPTYEGPDHDLDGKLQFHRRFYDEQCTGYPVDIVVCRHVIEHVAEPLILLGAVRKALDNSPHARVFFETPCVDWILHNHVVWDLFYEHCSIFNVNSITIAFQRAGFNVIGVRHVFEGQYLWVEAQPAQVDSAVKTRPADETPTVDAALEYGRTTATRIQSWVSHLKTLRQAGGVALWGAGAKGVTFANLCDPQGKLLDFIVDVNPNKQGKFLAGTGHPIIGPHQLPSQLAAILVLNPNYLAEVQATVAELGHSYPVLNLMDSSEQPV